MTWLRVPAAHVLVGALCLGLALANLERVHFAALAASVVAACALAAADAPGARLALVALVVALAGWWWAGVRLDALDQSPMLPRLVAPVVPSSS